MDEQLAFVSLIFFAWTVLAPIAFYLHRYGRYWIDMPLERLLCYHQLILFSATSMILVASYRLTPDEHCVPYLIVGWGTTIGILVQALFTPSINRMRQECDCSASKHIWTAYQCLAAGLLVTADAGIGTARLWSQADLPPFAFIGWCAYVSAWAVFLAASEKRLWQERPVGFAEVVQEMA